MTTEDRVIKCAICDGEEVIDLPSWACRVCGLHHLEGGDHGCPYGTWVNE